MRTAIDTNVLSALWSGEPAAHGVAAALTEAQSLGGLVICATVYSELRASPRATAKFVDAFLDDTSIAVDWTTEEVLWKLAAERFSSYAKRRRTQPGHPRRLLADFLVGAHALLHADRLMTLDRKRYEREFSEMVIL